MKRRDFLSASAVAAAVSVCNVRSVAAQGGIEGGMPKLAPPEKPAQLNLSLQWGMIPGGEIKEKLDYLEAQGYQAFETPTGDWLLKNGEALQQAMQGRKLFVATACGPSNFAYAEAEKREAEVQKFLPQIEVLGALKAVGLILCPARKNLSEPGWLSAKELRQDFVENTGKRLAQHAHKHGTNIVLEPLRRNETPFLRQVADGAVMARDIGPGATVMADFWHMALEEYNFFGAIVSAGKLLTHVHIASLKDRKIPGVDGAADNYVDGFKGLKLLGYRGAVSLEGGVPKGADKQQLLTNMQRLLKEQWQQA